MAGVSGNTIGQWARRGYIRSSRCEGPPRVYSYQDIGEAMVVHILLEANVSHGAIRDAITWLRQTSGSDWPLSKARLWIPTGHRVHEPPARKKKRSVIVEDERGPIDTRTGHPVLEEVDLERVAVDLRRGGWAARQLPDLRHIEVNPDRNSGRPVIAGSRVPAEDVARLALSEGGRKTLRRDYDLTDAQIDDAVRWWQVVSEYEQAA